MSPLFRDNTNIEAYWRWVCNSAWHFMSNGAADCN